MKLKVIDSGSDGNAYILYNDTHALLIECGVPFAKIKAALNFDLSKVVGCLITHEHQDHSKAVRDVLNAGIPVYASMGTLQRLKCEYHYNTKVVSGKLGNGQQFVGPFVIMAFTVQHDAKEPLGFMINHPDCGTVLFATDTYYLKQRFHGLNQVIIEANYCETILERRTARSLEHEILSERIIESHMSIQRCIQMLEGQDLRAVNNVVLIHLSNRNSDARSFRQQVEERTGKTVNVAEAGMVVDFGITPF